MPSGRGHRRPRARASRCGSPRGILGSPGLEVVGARAGGPAVRSRRSSSDGAGPRIAIHRRLSDIRVAPGTRVTVELEVENRSRAADLLPDGGGPAATGARAPGPARRLGRPRPRRSQRVTYTVLPQTRGRYRLGPLTVDVSDPFALTRQRLEFDERDELIGHPRDRGPAERTGLAPFGANVGASRARNLFRTGEEYYTMRQYQEGDDLRRIHWPSVARTGELMIRQDESSRRANGLFFVDTRTRRSARPTARRSNARSRRPPRSGSCSRAAGSRCGSRPPTRPGRRRHRGAVPRRAHGRRPRPGAVDRPRARRTCAPAASGRHHADRRRGAARRPASSPR